MKSRIEEVSHPVAMDALLELLAPIPGTMLLDSSHTGHPDARFSFLVTHPMLTLTSQGSSCHIHCAPRKECSTRFGNPWHIMEDLMRPFEWLHELDSPFPLGGCFGFWGYDLKHFVEPRLERRAMHHSPCPDAQLGLYPSLLVTDHLQQSQWIIATGFGPDGSWSATACQAQIDDWKHTLERAMVSKEPARSNLEAFPLPRWDSFPQKEPYLRSVQTAQRFIQQGDIYQLNLARALSVPKPGPALELYRRIQQVSPAPHGGFFQGGHYQLLCSSPESFLKLDGRHIRSRPIKGTRPRGHDAQSDATLAFQLQSSEKERAELLMITDLLRNDLGKVCEFGSVVTPEIMKLERYAQVQHLVSTVEGMLKADRTHLSALMQCFPGGSITGAPKFRAMEIIEQLEPHTRGPYTGSMGYMGFNQMSQWNILIRTAIRTDEELILHVGSGIVADSDPEAEFQETEDKAAGWRQALYNTRPVDILSHAQRQNAGQPPHQT